MLRNGSTPDTPIAGSTTIEMNVRGRGVSLSLTQKGEAVEIGGRVRRISAIEKEAGRTGNFQAMAVLRSIGNPGRKRRGAIPPPAQPGSTRSNLSNSIRNMGSIVGSASIASLQFILDTKDPSTYSSTSSIRKYKTVKNFFADPKVMLPEKIKFCLEFFNNELATAGTAFTKLISIFGSFLSFSLCFENQRESIIPIVIGAAVFSLLASNITYIQRRPYITIPAHINTYKKYDIQYEKPPKRKWNKTTEKVFILQTILGAFFAGLPYATGVQVLSGKCADSFTILLMLLALLPYATKNFLAESTKQRELYENKPGKTIRHSSWFNDHRYYFLYVMASIYPYLNSGLGAYGICTLIPELIQTAVEANGDRFDSPAYYIALSFSSSIAYVTFFVVLFAYFYFDGGIMIPRAKEFKPEAAPLPSVETSQRHPNAYVLVMGYPALYVTRLYWLRDLTIKLSSAFLVAAITAQFSSSNIAQLMKVYPNRTLDLSLTIGGLIIGFMMGGGVARSKLPSVPNFLKLRREYQKAKNWFLGKQEKDRQTRIAELNVRDIQDGSASDLSFGSNANFNPLHSIQHRTHIGNGSPIPDSASTQRLPQFPSNRSFQRPTTPVVRHIRRGHPVLSMSLSTDQPPASATESKSEMKPKN